jgi:hypothetical protein
MIWLFLCWHARQARRQAQNGCTVAAALKFTSKSEMIREPEPLFPQH